MMEEPTHPQQATDEYYAGSAVVHQFIEAVRAALAAEPGRPQLVERIEPAFQRLLAAGDWLPGALSGVNDLSGMGGGIGQYLLYRAADRSLTLSSLVVPPGSSTPIHDHLAWGLVGLYRGEQREEVFRQAAGDIDAGEVELELVEERSLGSGELYTLLPPENDIHRVTTISDVASVSIHLLGSDVGCTIRHRYRPESRAVVPFRSGYCNVPCPDSPHE